MALIGPSEIWWRTINRQLAVDWLNWRIEASHYSSTKNVSLAAHGLAETVDKAGLCDR